MLRIAVHQPHASAKCLGDSYLLSLSGTAVTGIQILGQDGDDRIRWHGVGHEQLRPASQPGLAALHALTYELFLPLALAADPLPDCWVDQQPTAGDDILAAAAGVPS